MHFFQNIFIVIIFCATLSNNTKIAGDAALAAAPIKQKRTFAPVQPNPVPITIPAKQPLPATPPVKPIAAQAPTFQTLIAYIKNTPSAWDRKNARLSTSFVSNMIKQVRAAQLDMLQLETLLQTARDVHGIFSGNQQKDSAILQSVDNQIASAIQ